MWPILVKRTLWTRFKPCRYAVGLESIQEALRNPKANLPDSIMLRFPPSKGQTQKIAYFLKNRVKDPFYATPMQIQAGLGSIRLRSTC
jgi:hypothetical protein